MRNDDPAADTKRPVALWLGVPVDQGQAQPRIVRADPGAAVRLGGKQRLMRSGPLAARRAGPHARLLLVAIHRQQKTRTGGQE